MLALLDSQVQPSRIKIAMKPLKTSMMLMLPLLKKSVEWPPCRTCKYSRMLDALR